MKQEVSKKEAALTQLDAAIAHYQAEQYISAITLAGAAEEIFAKLSGHSTFQRVRDAAVAEHGVSPKWITDNVLNEAKNWFKHASGTDPYSFDLKIEVQLLLFRAMTNLTYLDGEAALSRAPLLPFLDEPKGGAKKGS